MNATKVSSIAATKLMTNIRSKAAEERLTQQQYWQAIDEFVAQSQQALSRWHSKWKRAGIKPLTARQQQSRWVTHGIHCSMRHGWIIIDNVVHR